MIEKLLNYNPDDKAIDKVITSINSYRLNRTLIDTNKRNIEHLKKQLPDICPICGNVMKKGI